MSKRRKITAGLGAATVAAWALALATGFHVVTSHETAPLFIGFIFATALAASLTAATVSAVVLALTVPSSLAAFHYGRANPYPPVRHLRAVPDLTPEATPEPGTAQHQ